MELRIVALIFGIAFLGAGIAWYLPIFYGNNGLLLGLFEVDPMHNMVHLASGLIALVAASISSRLSRLYLVVFGFIYASLGIAGFIMPEQFLSMHFNMADHALHVVLGLVALILGLSLKVPAGE